MYFLSKGDIMNVALRNHDLNLITKVKTLHVNISEKMRARAIMPNMSLIDFDICHGMYTNSLLYLTLSFLQV